MPKLTNHDLQIKFGKHLRNIRESKSLSLSQVSSKCDVEKSNLAKIENGQFNIQLSKIFEIAKGLDVEPKDLLDFKF